MTMKAGSNLEKILTAGHFAATGELGPPQSADPEVIRKKASYLKGYVDSVNITDCQTAVVRMSSMSVAVILLGLGIEPNMQMTCRDRNRIAIQSDLLGASALGIKNLLCLTGDHQSFVDVRCGCGCDGYGIFNVLCVTHEYLRQSGLCHLVDRPCEGLLPIRRRILEEHQVYVFEVVEVDGVRSTLSKVE